jgi:hypothetical protein
MGNISWLAEDLLVSQEGLCSMDSRRPAADPRLRPLGHWDRQKDQIIIRKLITNLIWYRNNLTAVTSLSEAYWCPLRYSFSLGKGLKFYVRSVIYGRRYQTVERKPSISALFLAHVSDRESTVLLEDRLFMWGWHFFESCFCFPSM